MSIICLNTKALSSIFIAVFVVCVFGGSALAEDNLKDRERVLTATGVGEARARPDIAEVRLGVATELPNASDAARANAAKMSGVVQAVKALGVPDRDIQTSIYQISAVRRFEPGSNQVGEPPIVGYRVSNVISVRTSNLQLVPKVIDDSVRAGANTVEDVNFLLRDQTTANDTALRQAASNARRNAETMAKELGVKLVAIKNVQQGVANIGPIPMYARAAASESAPSTPIFPGEVAVSATVTLTYIIQ